MPTPQVLRYAAFSLDPAGGNPAGVVLDAEGLDEAAMQRIAAEVDYAETAFVTGGTGDGGWDLRYFSPIAEVPFCGHATLATAVALAPAGGTLTFRTPVGPVVIVVSHDEEGARASFASIEPQVSPLPDDDLAAIVALLGLRGGAGREPAGGADAPDSAPDPMLNPLLDPGLLTVDIPVSGGIVVSGHAVPIG